MSSAIAEAAVGPSRHHWRPSCAPHLVLLGVFRLPKKEGSALMTTPRSPFHMARQNVRPIPVEVEEGELASPHMVSFKQVLWWKYRRPCEEAGARLADWPRDVPPDRVAILPCCGATMACGCAMKGHPFSS
jgi:hypothetical protein